MDEQSEKVKAFLNEIRGVCEKHNLSLSHEDGHGAFLVEDFDAFNISHLLEAFDKTTQEEGR